MDSSEQSEKKENILDIMAQIDAMGDGDKSHLNDRVENMERQIVESGASKSYIEPVQAMGFEEIAAQQQLERDQQIDAAARGIRPSEMRVGEHGSTVASRQTGGNTAPRISDFFIIDTPMTPEVFMKLLNKEVLGHYDVQDRQGEAEFGIMCLSHVQGLPGPVAALPGATDGPSSLSRAKPMLVVKLDAGAWSWYDAASAAILAGIVKSTGRRAWRCGWALDKQWSWVEHWKQGKHGGDGKMTETIDGPETTETTRKARERWGIDARHAFDELMKAAQWEALRQWLLKPEPRPTGDSVRVSFLAGNLLIQPGDPEWIVPGWAEKFPGRKPEDGALHLQAYYVRAAAPIPEKEMVQSFRTEPPLLGS